MCKVNASMRSHAGHLENVCAACTMDNFDRAGRILNNKEVIWGPQRILDGIEAGDAPAAMMRCVSTCNAHRDRMTEKRAAFRNIFTPEKTLTQRLLALRPFCKLSRLSCWGRG